MLVVIICIVVGLMLGFSIYAIIENEPILILLGTNFSTLIILVFYIISFVILMVEPATVPIVDQTQQLEKLNDECYVKVQEDEYIYMYNNHIYTDDEEFREINVINIPKDETPYIQFWHEDYENSFVNFYLKYLPSTNHITFYIPKGQIIFNGEGE